MFKALLIVAIILVASSCASGSRSKWGMSDRRFAIADEVRSSRKVNILTPRKQTRDEITFTVPLYISKF
jgi:hypothetical protein